MLVNELNANCFELKESGKYKKIGDTKLRLLLIESGNVNNNNE